MDLKGLWVLCLLSVVVCLLPQSSAQCSLDLGSPFANINGVPFGSFFPEYSPSNFIQKGLTYLCYTRSKTNSETFSEIRVSVLYQYEGTDGALQLTLVCIGSRWFYDRTQPSLLELSAAEHVMENRTREGCANCHNTSTASFRDPTYCSEESSISESSSVDSSYKGPPATVGGVHSAQVSDAIIGVVVAVAAVVVLVIVGTVVIASPIAWKLRKGRKTTAGVPPPKASTDVAMQDNPSYITVEERVVLQPNPCYSAVQVRFVYDSINAPSSGDYEYI